MLPGLKAALPFIEVTGQMDRGGQNDLAPNSPHIHPLEEPHSPQTGKQVHPSLPLRPSGGRSDQHPHRQAITVLH